MKDDELLQWETSLRETFNRLGKIHLSTRFRVE